MMKVRDYLTQCYDIDIITIFIAGDFEGIPLKGCADDTILDSVIVDVDSGIKDDDSEYIDLYIF